MSEDKIKEAYERFDDFEKELFGVTNITWKSDEEMNSSVHYNILSEKFGPEKVDDVLKNSGVDIKYLSNHDSFLKIFEMLNQ